MYGTLQALTPNFVQSYFALLSSTNNKETVGYAAELFLGNIVVFQGYFLLPTRTLGSIKNKMEYDLLLLGVYPFGKSENTLISKNRSFLTTCLF